MSETFRILAQGVGPDGTQLADERESLLWGFVNMLDAQTQRLDRTADKLMPGLRDLQREQDGTEIKSRELELVTDRAELHRTARRVSGAGCPPEFQLDAGSKFQGRSSRMRDCGWPAAIFSSVFVSQA